MRKLWFVIKYVLEGKIIGLSLHAAVVHIPIALWTMSVLADLFSFEFPGSWQVRGAFYLLCGGIVGALMAAPLGMVDWLDIRRDHPAKKLGLLHAMLNSAALGLFLVSMIFRIGRLDAFTTPLLPLILSLIGLGVVFVSGFIGGMMVYDDGIGVGRHRRTSPTPVTTRDLSGESSSEGYVFACNVGDLQDGQTLRLQLDGNILCLARSGEDYFAFQEFCTHRYGPLSEGKISDGCVTCPWHGSEFDCRTGQVVNGPAKVPLKVYDVRVSNGQVEVRPAMAETASS